MSYKMDNLLFKPFRNVLSGGFFFHTNSIKRK
mgnify:CR=1 FL=1